MSTGKLCFEPLDPSNWKLFQDLFGDKGACGGCWCMHWRLTNKEFLKNKGSGNKSLMKRLAAVFPPGIIARYDDEAIGWCAIAPRTEYKRLETSRILQPVDDNEVWSISCFYIRKDHRRTGLSVKLIKAAVGFAKKHGAQIIEANPLDPQKGKSPDAFAWTGISTSFIKAGFAEVARRSEYRPIVRIKTNS